MAASIGAWLLAIVMGSAFASAEATRFHLLLQGRARLLASEVIDRALRRVESPSCQRVLSDFVDGTGRTLGENLDASGLTFRGYVARLHFIDGDGDTRCTTGVVTAFTMPGSRVIYLCSTRFTTMFSAWPEAETLFIHEILHTLGLGENPPSSSEISRLVWRRCVMHAPDRDRGYFARRSTSW